MRGMAKGRRERLIEQYPFDFLMPKLLRSLPELEGRGLRSTLDGLRDWFRICHRSGLKDLLGMPSRAVDQAWHEMILFTKGYQGFCKGAFGRYLHHTPEQALSPTDDLDAGLAHTFELACQIEGIVPARPERLPRIFGLDDYLGSEHGMRYALGPFVGPGGETIPFQTMRREADTGAWVPAKASAGGCASSSGCGSGGSSGCGGNSSGSGCGGGCGGGGCGGG